MSFKHLGKPDIGNAQEVQFSHNLFKPENQLGDSQIFIREMTINENLPKGYIPIEEEGFTHGEDLARIRAREDTPVQRYDGKDLITEIMFDSIVIGSEVDSEEGYTPPQRTPVGIILMSPNGEISLYVYDPRTDGGPRSYSISEGWRMQTIIPEGTELRFYDHWSENGFCNNGDKARYHGYEVLPDETDPDILDKFKDARDELVSILTELKKNI